MFLKTLCDLAMVADSVQLHVMKIQGSDQFQVVIQPSLALAEKHPALAQPLMVTETADKLEAEVVTALTQFTPMVDTAKANLAQIQSSLDAALQAARDKAANKKPTAPATKAGGGTTTSAVKPTTPMQKPTESAPDLFGPTPSASSTQQDAGTSEPVMAGTGDDDDDDLPGFPGM
ncbi:PRTRC system protein E [Curvibacter sp. APW13]|uniref:PRTRC system protein E n=1 Tax=Curvibacter sp. APW13 TaxID=3077236 RepID=UPI0028DE472B|nr:PRTRC system protein E [Curvibacter sp. APW13]MDT8992817.1 PRTRC system protein E [Curvibacter sp. APW13]